MRPREIRPAPAPCPPLRGVRPRPCMTTPPVPTPTQNGPPEMSDHRERFPRLHRLLHLFPRHRNLHKSPCPSFAGHTSVRPPDELKEPLFPGLRPYFHVNP